MSKYLNINNITKAFLCHSFTYLYVHFHIFTRGYHWTINFIDPLSSLYLYLHYTFIFIIPLSSLYLYLHWPCFYLP